MHNRGYHVFVENFWSHNAENFRGHPFNVLETLGYRKNLSIIGGITFFRRKFFGLTVPKTFVGIPSMFQKIGSVEKLHA